MVGHGCRRPSWNRRIELPGHVACDQAQCPEDLPGAGHGVDLAMEGVVFLFEEIKVIPACGRDQFVVKCFQFRQLIVCRAGCSPRCQFTGYECLDVEEVPYVLSGEWCDLEASAREQVQEAFHPQCLQGLAGGVVEMLRACPTTSGLTVVPGLSSPDMMSPRT